MKTAVLVSIMVVVTLVAGPLLQNSYAEQVDHHGLKADSEASLEICVSCHDGSVSNNVPFCSAKCAFNTPHAVLKNYPPVGERKKYAPTSVILSKGIRLVNGQITCISCHDLNNPAKYHLVVENQNSRLCLICHIK